jgi:hypothetical protein
MRLFSEKVNPTFNSSGYNILTVKDYTEVFFDVYEFEINGSKFVAEKTGVLDDAPSMKFKPKDGGAFFALPKSYLQSIGVSNQGEYIEYLRNLNNFQKEEVNKKLE